MKNYCVNCNARFYSETGEELCPSCQYACGLRSDYESGAGYDSRDRVEEAERNYGGER